MEVGGLADVVDLYIARQFAIDSYSEASDTGRWLYTDGLEVKCACWTLSSLSRIGADHDGFGFVWVH